MSSGLDRVTGWAAFSQSMLFASAGLLLVSNVVEGMTGTDHHTFRVVVISLGFACVAMCNAVIYTTKE